MLSLCASLVALLLAGCSREPGSTTLTEGALAVDCDEAVYPALRLVAEEFHPQYPDARVEVRSVEAREATANFVNDSVQVIVDCPAAERRRTQLSSPRRRPGSKNTMSRNRRSPSLPTPTIR